MYLCPTRQLAQQVAGQARSYGLDVITLVDSHRQWDPTELQRHRRGQAVTVTTYSHIFNSDPKLQIPQTLVLDDAHAVDGYVASNWMFIARREEPLYAALRAVLCPGVREPIAERLADDQLDPVQRGDVHIVEPSVFAERAPLVEQALAAQATADRDPNLFVRRSVGGHTARLVTYVSWHEIHFDR